MKLRTDLVSEYAESLKRRPVSMMMDETVMSAWKDCGTETMTDEELARRRRLAEMLAPIEEADRVAMAERLDGIIRGDRGA